MCALVTCCTALTGCPFKSNESQKIQSSQRFFFQVQRARVVKCMRAGERFCEGAFVRWLVLLWASIVHSQACQRLKIQVSSFIAV